MKKNGPATIRRHPAVEEVLYGPAVGSDYRWDVWLKPAYRFASGRMAGLRGGRFNSAQEFLDCGVRKATDPDERGN